MNWETTRWRLAISIAMGLFAMVFFTVIFAFADWIVSDRRNGIVLALGVSVGVVTWIIDWRTQ